MASKREVAEGEQEVGEDERIAFVIDTANWGGTPTSPAVVVKDVTAGWEDVTSTVMPSGSASVDADDITLPLLRDLTKNHEYRVEVKFTITGNLCEAFIKVPCRR